MRTLNEMQDYAGKIFSLGLTYEESDLYIRKAEMAKRQGHVKGGSIGTYKHSLSISLRTSNTPFCQPITFLVKSDKQDGDTL